ncbi:MAG: hypothetical protein NW215_03440 [Hyphomicrobiales bacterium]|nr:hypothetical protein [Hyphomicrobiales bacterium]
MTKLLNKAFETMSALPEARQDEVAQMLIDLAQQEQSDLTLSEDQKAEVRRRLSSPADYASDAEAEAFFRRTVG